MYQKIIDWNGKGMTPEARKQKVDEYIAGHPELIEGKGRSKQILQELADFLLADELKDGNKHKSRKADAPILSDSQLKYREKKEVTLNRMSDAQSGHFNNEMFSAGGQTT